jgi:hypothetical protein
MARRKNPSRREAEDRLHELSQILGRKARFAVDHLRGTMVDAKRELEFVSEAWGDGRFDLIMGQAGISPQLLNEYATLLREVTGSAPDWYGDFVEAYPSVRRSNPTRGNRRSNPSLSKDELVYSFGDFTLAYIEAALWAETDPDTMTPLDDEYGMWDITVAGLRAMHRDCLDFQKQAEAALKRAGLAGQYDVDTAQAGHDFWLTRNRHGAGFWDRGLGRVGDVLTEVAQSFGETYLMPNGRGKLNYDG